MSSATGDEGYRDRSLALKLIGATLMIGGLAAAFIGPLELYTFYAFSEGGRFHYEGFGVGSFMFANIAAQTAGYYLIAAIALPLGYGHLTLRRWARSLALTLLGFWLVAGLPLTAIFVVLLFDAKAIPAAGSVIVLPLAILLYPVGPILLYRLYEGRGVRLTLESRDSAPSALDAIPLSVRVLCALLGFYVLVLHLIILLNGLFPLFGDLLVGVQGIMALDVAIIALLGLIWGLARLRRWAWWGTLIGSGLLLLSSILTCARYTVGDLLAQMDLPAREMELFANLPFLDQHPTLIVAIPLLVILAVILAVGRHFNLRLARPGG